MKIIVQQKVEGEELRGNKTAEDSLGLICVGDGAGIFEAIAAGRLLARFVEGMRPAQPSTLVIMISALVIAALLASFMPARRASRVDPMTTLRQN